jgi:hypothetical protein
MNKQLDLFQARDIGIQKAVDNANDNHNGWSDDAYAFLIRYIQNNPTFMTEDVRNKSKGIIPDPPSNRAWGGIIVRAVKNGRIKRIGYQNTKNIKAHGTPASLWIKI